MNRLRKYFYLIILYAFTAAAYTHPQNSFAQEKPVEINAKSMGSFTRVEIKGEKNFKVNQKEGRLVIRFPAPVDLSLGGLRASLDQVIDSVNLSPNHKSITIELNGRFKTREFLGSKYAGFDLIRIGEAPIKTAHKSPSIDKAAKPEKAIPDEGIKPQINTKAASKPEVSKPEKVVVNTSAIAENDKLRISFKWPVVAKYRVANNKGEVGIEFNHSAEIKLPDVSGYTNFISEISASNNKVNLKIPDTVSLKHFKEQKNIVFELTVEKKGEPEKFPEKEPKLAKAEPTPKDVIISEKVISESSEIDKPKAEIPKQVPLPEVHTEEEEEQEVAAPRDQALEKFMNIPDAVDAKTVFKIPEGLSFAIYERNNHLWVFIESDEKEEKTDKKVTENSFPVEWSEISQSGSALLWVPINPTQQFEISKNDDELTIQFSKEKKPAPFQFGISAEFVNNQTSSLKIAMKPPYLINKINDPIVGDKLIIVSSEGITTGNKSVRKSIDIEFLKSYSGAAVALSNDEVDAEPVQDGVILKSPEAFISIKSLLVSGEKPSVRMGHIDSFVPYDAWKPTDDENYINSRQEILQRFMISPKENKPYFRLRLAQELVARGLPANALGKLAPIKDDTPEFYKKNKLAGLSAVINIYQNRYAEAIADLKEPEIEQLPESQSLLKFIGYITGTPPDSKFNFAESYMTFIKNYPPYIQKDMAIRTLRKLYATNKLDESDALVKFITEEAIITAGDIQKKELDYITAKIHETSGDATLTDKIWAELASDINNREFRAKASFDIIKRDYLNGTISRADAIKKLNALRNTWREPDFEIPLLEYIGNLALIEKDYNTALDAFRYMVTYFPDDEKSKKASQKMDETFVKLFNKGGVDHMTPLDALTLYYEFRELTPVGEEGDEMIRNLADRLVEVELLDRASALLTHQVRFRLQGEKKIQVATRLALIHLLNQKPKLALEVLEYSDANNIPEELANKRKEIKVQALNDIGKFDDALEILNGDARPEAQKLSLEVLWAAKKWDSVIKNLEPDIAAAAKSGKPLPAETEHNLVRLALAYMFTGKTDDVQKLYENYGPLMATPALKEQLHFLASDSEGIDHENIQAVNDTIGKFESFMDGFKKQVKEEGLSKVIK